MGRFWAAPWDLARFFSHMPPPNGEQREQAAAWGGKGALKLGRIWWPPQEILGEEAQARTSLSRA
jgi:hypothetical protein